MSVTTPREAKAATLTDAEMLYSAASLKLVDHFTRRVGDFLERSALALAKGQGRNLVTEEDFSTIIDQLGWSIPDEDDADGR